MPNRVPITQLEPVVVPKERFKGERQLRLRMSRDFPFYALNLLKVLGKEGGIIPFELNRAQRYIHEKLEAQYKRIGRIRALVCKARQMGCSTLVAGRFYHRVTHRKGVNAFVLSHAQDTTKKLFKMTRTFYDESDGEFKPSTTAASANELSFGNLKSTYYVGTAGTKGVGRGGTVQYFHGSEVALWTNADEHFGGIMQSIPTGKMSGGTEIILESTGQGPRGKFYDLCMSARKGDGEYQLIFTPWHWQDEYRQTPPVGWGQRQSPHEALIHQQAEIALEDYGYVLDEEQKYWLELKRIELGSDWLCRQEFPGTLDEAFQQSGEESFFSPKQVDEARIPKPEIDAAVQYALGEPRIGALDPAGSSARADRTGIGHREGQRMENIEYHKGLEAPELVKMAREYIQKWELDVLFIDVGGLGGPIYQYLRRNGYERIVRPCNGANSAVDLNPDGSRKYANKRAECHGRCQEWFNDGPVEIPNSDELRTDLLSTRYDRDKGYLQMEGKKQMRARGVQSPDGSDVLVMTFTEKVRSRRLRGISESVKVKTVYDELDYGLIQT